MKFLSILAILACLTCWTTGCSEEQEPNPCVGVTCSGRGDCVNMGGRPFCRCEPPYKTSASGKECKLACEDVTCSAHGSCIEADGQPLCVCNTDYVASADGKSCVLDGDPCAGINCCGTGTCMVDGQGQPYCECTGDTQPNDKNPLCCTAPCDVVDICGLRMCTEENDCCGYGRCKVDEDGEAFCECEYAYRMDLYDRTCCVRTGQPLELGQICSSGTDCKTNFCLMYGGEDTGYCSKRDCNTNSECKNHSFDGNAMCCEDIGGESYACFKLGTGCNCGDNSGGCGTSCACQSNTACGINFVCLASAAAGLDDPNAYCSKQCNTHEDCNECDDPEDPNTIFTCDAIGGGQKYCQPTREDGCRSKGDCLGTDVCIPIPNDELTEMIGMCATFGDLNTGDVCDSAADPNILPSEERCAGFYCMNDHCSEVCEFDADCPEGMRCGTVGFGIQGTDAILYVGMCQWFGGSNRPCGGYTDCPDGELCQYYVTANEELVKLCITENCAMEAPDCSAPGTENCGDDNADPCWGGMCLVSGDGTSFCSALCESSDHCPGGTICICCLGVSDTLTVPICFPFDGSANPCGADNDCPNGEVCIYNQGLEGFEAICKVRNDPGAPIGDECGPGLPPCYNDLCVTSGNDSYCSAVCHKSADCPTGFFCDRLNLGDNNIWGACVEADGSARPCGSNTDCPAGEACFYFATLFSELETRCLQAHTPGGQPGDACDAGQNRCVNDMCYDNVCSAVCDSNSVCSQYGRDCVWYNVVPGLYGPACMQPDTSSPLCSLCAADADCGGDAKCIESSANPGEKYCGLPCPAGNECGSLTHPMGPFTCTDVGGAVNNCKPDGDTCDPNN